MSVGRGRQLDLEVTDPVELGEDSGQGVLGLVSGCGFGVGIEEIVDGFEKRFEESEERLGKMIVALTLQVVLPLKAEHSDQRRAAHMFRLTSVYATLISSSWNWLKTILFWYKQQESQTNSASEWPALYASVLLGAVFGLLSMVAALAVAVPATLVIWITVVVMLTFFGKPRRVLVVEGRKITKEIIGFVFKILLREGNAVAAVAAVLGYFVLFRRKCEVD
ncbi:hypothetical protein DKX38_020147 [Salix brachista]|uniref:Uncharacterized protein n=1 Tax=Salix brachista TaxID=2182728 RepID=A0A5N5KII4_9ROSI|nr:hypothetical protein DKX38_020147 [Salix brachista]